MTSNFAPQFGRRQFIAAAAATAAFAPTIFAEASRVRRTAGKVRVGAVGCGGRGTGAMGNILEASPDVEIVALGDAFPDRLQEALNNLKQLPPDRAARVKVDPDHQFTGLDAYKKVLASDIDLVILATPPGFRPIHFAAAVEAGKHIFFEKPVAVDPPGIRAVIDAAKKAADKKLVVVTGTQRRHGKCYNEAMKRIQDGAIGQVISSAVFWNMGGLWVHPHEKQWSDAEWQIRNWLYFTWLSGDHIVEQHVHNLDIAHWAMNTTPDRVLGMGGRQARTAPEYGQIYDHFAVQYEYGDGRSVASYCRQTDGTDGRVEEVIYGTEGRAILADLGGRGRAEIIGKNPWKFSGPEDDAYVVEHRDLLASINGGAYINEGERIAKSTMMAIAGRMSAYTGKSLKWDNVMKSEMNLMPKDLTLASDLPVPPVAIPGKRQTHA